MPGEVVDMVLRAVPNPDPELTTEELRNLAFLAVKLPAALSRRQIEQLGLSVLLHLRQLDLPA